MLEQRKQLPFLWLPQQQLPLENEELSLASEQVTFFSTHSKPVMLSQLF
jgi:hypothetical protein